MNNTSSQLTEKIIDCTESFQSFNLYAPHILNDIFSNPRANFKPFLVVIYRILEEKEESPVNKFYALYLLAWILQKNPSEDFVEGLFEHRDLISLIFNAGQYDLDNGTRVSERGRTYFNNHPQTDEAIIGINFVRLSLELIMYVKQILEEKRNNYTFSNYLFNIDEITRGRELPMKNWLIGVQHSENIELATYNFINPSSSRGPITGGSAHKSSVSEPEIRIQNYPKLNSCQIQNDDDSPTTAAAKKRAQQQEPEYPAFGGGVEDYRKAPTPNPSSNNAHNRINSAGKSPLDFGKKKTLGERMAEQGIFSATGESRTPRRGQTAEQTPPTIERSNSNLRTKRTPNPNQEPSSPLNKSQSAQEIRDFFSSRQKPNQARQAGTITQIWDPQPDNFREQQDTDRILQGANQIGEGYPHKEFNHYDVDPYSKQQFQHQDRNFEAPKKNPHMVQGGNYGHDDFETQRENALLKERIRELERELKEMKTHSDQNLARENTVLKNKLADLVQKTEGLNNTIKGLVDENCQLSDSLQQKSKEIEDLKKAQPSSRQQTSFDPYNPAKKPVAVDTYDRPGAHERLHSFPTASKESSSPNNFYISSVKEPDSGSERTVKQTFRTFQSTPMEESKPHFLTSTPESYGIKQQQQFSSDGKKQVVIDTYNYPPAGVGHGYSYSGAATGVTSKPYEGYGGAGEAPKGFLQEPQQSTDDLYGQNTGGKRKLFEKVTYEKPKMVLTAKDYI